MNQLLISKNRIKTISLPLVLLFLLFSCSFLLFFSSSCRLYNLEKKLDPVNAEFLNKVRYIITKKERKIFLELPDSEKEAFKEEFWERRDPNPDTEENEFKMEYFTRLDRAEELFMGEGKPGWLTDRGRIYILFGPPQYRETHTIESSDPTTLLYRRCGEVWHYPGFPVVFVDSMCTGNNLRLATYDLTALRSINLMYMHEFAKFQAEAQTTFSREKGFFDFDISINKTVVESDRVEGTVIIEIPYAAIWYKAEELFMGEGKPGWLTDRGRIYILFGPPQYRETHTIESSDPTTLLYRRCGEIWHYPGFPVVFVDSTCTGNNLRLVTYDLTALRSINLMYMHEFAKFQEEAQITFTREKGFFDFDISINKTVVESDRVEGIVTIEIPYAAIWYKAEEDTLKTTIDVRIELKDFEDNLVWEYGEPFEIEMKEEELKERQKKNYKIEIPFILEKDLDKLRQEKGLFLVVLKNRTGGGELKKVMEFKLY
jgi:GWxTD domain-containing protein